MCITRWVEYIDGFERLTLCHLHLIKVCEIILYGDSTYPMVNEGWTAEVKRNYLAYLKALESFEFLYCMVTLHRYLLYLKGATVKLQGKQQHILSGVQLFNSAVKI